MVCRSHTLASLFGSAKFGGVTGWAQGWVLPRETAPYDEMKTGRLQVAMRRSRAAVPQS